MTRADRMNDEAYMRVALVLARRGLGETAPNPSVGCIIVKNTHVVGRGHTAPGGRPHAEVLALKMAGEAAYGATAYVTLEPCAHVDKISPPCTNALIEAGIKRVVIGAVDPNPKVNGVGIQRLREAGVQVSENILETECLAVISGFMMTITKRRPLIRLKLASTLDGKIATSSSESKWITGEASRRAAHAMRGRHDAIMVGVGTVLTDDPDLTCRLDGFRTAPLIRIVIDSHLRTPLMSRLVRTAGEHPLWLLHRNGADPRRKQALEQAGVKLIELPASPAGVDLAVGMEKLEKAGLTRILAEGGGTLAAGLLRANLVDRLAWFHAPGIIGGDGWPAAQGFGITTLAAMPRFVPVAQERFGDDMLTTYRKAI
jgi:diaminohydroxyphosphoribosylaminopyrimidine deaminase / 5-amino-6-(5-phosphoribosylamino)uracil reductase